MAWGEPSNYLYGHLLPNIVLRVPVGNMITQTQHDWEGRSLGGRGREVAEQVPNLHSPRPLVAVYILIGTRGIVKRTIEQVGYHYLEKSMWL